MHHGFRLAVASLAAGAIFFSGRIVTAEPRAFLSVTATVDPSCIVSAIAPQAAQNGDPISLVCTRGVVPSVTVIRPAAPARPQVRPLALVASLEPWDVRPVGPDGQDLWLEFSDEAPPPVIVTVQF